MNLDEVAAQMALDELSDSGWMTPINYAKMRKLYPQRVYRAIREDKLGHKRCDCGRVVVSVADADVLFGFAEEVEDDEE